MNEWKKLWKEYAVVALSLLALLVTVYLLRHKMITEQIKDAIACIVIAVVVVVWIIANTK